MRESMEKDLVFRLVCNIYRHRDELKKISPAVEAMSFQNIDRFNAVPLHAGAAHFKNNRTDECESFST